MLQLGLICQKHNVVLYCYVDDTQYLPLKCDDDSKLSLANLHIFALMK